MLVATETIHVIRRLEFFVSTSQPLGRERAGDGVQSSVASALIKSYLWNFNKNSKQWSLGCFCIGQHIEY